MSDKRKSGTKCLRCGRCCWWFDVTHTWRPCRFLTVDSKGLHTCTRYHKRLGTHIGNGYYCCYRIDSGLNIPNCPYNVKGFMPHPKYINEKTK